MSVIYINSYQFAAAAPPSGYDPDAQAYITAVEAADTAAGSPGGLETAVKDAINAFVVGCKADGIWTAIKASCILAGARTLEGALQPLVGAAPTSYNFTSGDYARKTGLAGDGFTKYLNSNRAGNADPATNSHISVFMTEQNHTGTGKRWISSAAGNYTLLDGASANGARARHNSGTIFSLATTTGFTPSLCGISRASSANFNSRVFKVSQVFTNTVGVPTADNITIYVSPDLAPTNYSSNRFAFYSIGEALNLELLDARVDTLINALAAAIP